MAWSSSHINLKIKTKHQEETVTKRRKFHSMGIIKRNKRFLVSTIKVAYVGSRYGGVC